MKYTSAVTIDLPRKRVVELFGDPDSLIKWQPTLREFTPTEGQRGQPGARTRLVYDEGSREMEMIETIIRRNLPDEFTATYEAKGVWNLVENRFFDLGDTTRWEIETEFKFKGLMILMGLFMRGAFPKQTLKGMNDFKDFAESA